MDPLDELMKELEIKDQILNNSAPSIVPSAVGRLRGCDKNIASSSSCGDLSQLKKGIQPMRVRSASSQQLDKMWEQFTKGKPEFANAVASGPVDLCCECGESIDEEVVSAFGKKYHASHFKCTICKGQISSSSSFYDVNGPTCKSCYTQTNNLSSCSYCKLPIDTNSVSAIGTKWHEACFVCNHCCNPFTDGKFYAQEGMPYCPVCYKSQYATLCAGCNEEATGSIIRACDRTYHSKCFVCSTCGASLDGLFFQKNGEPYCFPHYQELQ